MAVTGPTLPFLKDQVGVTITEISYIFTARSIGTLGGAFLGMQYDKMFHLKHLDLIICCLFVLNCYLKFIIFSLFS